jgi:hypothetical protein
LLLFDASARHRSPLATTETELVVLLSCIANRFNLSCACANISEEPRASSSVFLSLLTGANAPAADLPPFFFPGHCAGTAFVLRRRSRTVEGVGDVDYRKSFFFSV